MKIDTTAKLVAVEGNQEEYADLIGVTGRLHLNPKCCNWFGNGGDSVEFRRKRVTRKEDKIRVHTKLGNVFVFRLVSESKK